jgi:hypothetical protein
MYHFPRGPHGVHVVVVNGTVEFIMPGPIRKP